MANYSKFVVFGKIRSCNYRVEIIINFICPLEVMGGNKSNFGTKYNASRPMILSVADRWHWEEVQRLAQIATELSSE
jgi:hypothetical protein